MFFARPGEKHGGIFIVLNVSNANSLVPVTRAASNEHQYLGNIACMMLNTVDLPVP